MNNVPGLAQPPIAPALRLLTLRMEPEPAIYSCDKKLNVDALPVETLAGGVFVPTVALTHLTKMQKRWQVWMRASLLDRMTLLKPW